MKVLKEFHSSLLREKFIIDDPNVSRAKSTPIIAVSNRMVISMQKDQNTPAENFVLRTQNMHSCVQLASKVIQDYNAGGSLRNRAHPYDWKATWQSVISSYERLYNDELWGAVYHRGKVIFEVGKRHPLLDVIEKCDFENNKDYDFAIPLAENAFQQTGKVVKIDYDSNVALNVAFSNNEGRCGVILRGANGTTTFNFRAIPKQGEFVNIPRCLSMASSFLEGIQHAYSIGFIQFKLRAGVFSKGSAEETQIKQGHKRLNRLDVEIANAEDDMQINYRPEKPDFKKILAEAELLASRVIDVPKT